MVVGQIKSIILMEAIATKQRLQLWELNHHKAKIIFFLVYCLQLPLKIAKEEIVIKNKILITRIGIHYLKFSPYLALVKHYD